MGILLDGEKLKKGIRKKTKIADLLASLEMSRETVIVKVNNRIVTEFDSAGPADKIDIIRVSTGG